MGDAKDRKEGEQQDDGDEKDSKEGEQQDDGDEKDTTLMVAASRQPELNYNFRQTLHLNYNYIKLFLPGIDLPVQLSTLQSTLKVQFRDQ